MLDAAESVLAAVRAGVSPASDGYVLCDDAGAVALLLPCAPSQGSRRALASARCEPMLDAAGKRLAELLTARRLRSSVRQLAQSERLQHALFAIADMAGSDHDMPTMLRGLHEIVGGLMYAENFYIALFDSESDSLRFLYFVDTVDDEDPVLDAPMPMSELMYGCTWYLVRDAKALMGPVDGLRRQVSGPLHQHGASSKDWLGVPMMRHGQVRGVVVVQSYGQEDCYSDADRALLGFVAEHILTALERKQDQAQLERRVAERTRQLAETNQILQEQVRERERSEQVQTSLYKIAALANVEDEAARFYRHIHLAVGELINARNFYIALLSADGQQIEFPYFVDDKDSARPPRPLGRGVSEYVIRTGRPVLVDPARARELMEAGEIEASPVVGTISLYWLGVPLLDADKVIGVIAVQSYSEDLAYDERDAELLTFVSYQIANSLQRRNSAEALRRLNAELEQRVQVRTRELREQIAVREQVEAQLKHQVMHDPLTGLPNRLYLRDRIERAIAGLRRNPERCYALLYLDVDRFKLFNDSLGHLAGDEVLREVSRRLGDCIREPDVVARLSGDEFAVLLEDVPLPKVACKVAQRIQDALSQPMHVAGRDLQTSASIGIAIGDARYTSTDQLLHDADVALYRAKSAGRQRFVLFDDSLQRQALDVLGVEHELRNALVRREFEPYFQPLVDLADGAVIGYEALVRWRHPVRGVLPPGEFLPVAEDSGLLEAIDWSMYRMACEAGVALVGEGQFMTINISPRHFQNPQFDVHLLKLAREAGFDPARLRIEVTESTLLGDPDAVAAILERLREACVDAALDDFGTGYSSLTYVQRFPLKMIKIDRSFVEPLGRGLSQRSSAIVAAILALAKSLGLDVVAEGIETEAQRQALQKMGCVHGQGFLFGRPEPASHWPR
ncbi:putative bifunctional diguanylate cyclase/phosphodiesterase [Lysobacter sp. A3-1-A15]